jgi:hypothetical protein
MWGQVVATARGAMTSLNLDSRCTCAESFTQTRYAVPQSRGETYAAYWCQVINGKRPVFHRSMSAASPEQSSLGLEGGVTDDDMYDMRSEGCGWHAIRRYNMAHEYIILSPKETSEPLRAFGFGLSIW